MIDSAAYLIKRALDPITGLRDAQAHARTRRERHAQSVERGHMDEDLLDTVNFHTGVAQQSPTKGAIIGGFAGAVPGVLAGGIAGSILSRNPKGVGIGAGLGGLAGGGLGGYLGYSAPGRSLNKLKNLAEGGSHSAYAGSTYSQRLPSLDDDDDYYHHEDSFEENPVYKEHRLHPKQRELLKQWLASRKG